MMRINPPALVVACALLLGGMAAADTVSHGCLKGYSLPAFMRSGVPLRPRQFTILEQK